MKAIGHTLAHLIFFQLFFLQHICCQLNNNLLPVTTRAILFGVSSYHDSLLPPLPEAKSDAEQFAAFLRSRNGGLIPGDLIQLMTGEEATMAHLFSMGNWVQEESRPGDHTILYFSCHARLLEKENNLVPYLFFTDSPRVPAGAGALRLSSLFQSVQVIGIKNLISYQLYLDLKIPPDDDPEIWRQWMYAFQQSFPNAFFSISNSIKKTKDKSESQCYSHLFLNGVMGGADTNNDQNVMPSEMAKIFKKNVNKIPKGEIFFMGFSSGQLPISRVQNNFSGKNKKDNLFLPIVGQETSRLEDSLIREENQKIKQWYNDFIITMKLGQLMLPPGRCASDLYDSLATVENLKPLYRRWQRKLGAALLDETQQALNAYLKTDSRELFRRWKHANHYSIYPGYMERAIELMGGRSFMHDIMQTKFHYFVGLKHRLDGEKENDIQAFKKALKAQELALTFEPEAAFVLNEIGVLHERLNSFGSEQYFLKALDYSPTWSIPHLNLSVYYLSANQPEKAMEYAIQSARLNPESAIASNNLGIVHLNFDNYTEAEKYFRQAIALDIKYEVPYYNLSCTKALQGKHDAALQWLDLAIERGFDNWDKIESDPDLASVRNSEFYEDLKRKYSKNK